MMYGMTIQERLDDISRESGLSQEVVRRVLDAERISISRSLSKGERAMLIGRCLMKPSIVGKLEIGGTMSHKIKVTVTPTKSLMKYLEDTGQYDDFGEDDTPGILTGQIEDLV